MIGADPPQLRAALPYDEVAAVVENTWARTDAA